MTNYYCAMDIFALPSREDPFPLVMLKAGAYGLATVCFAHSGGGPEFVSEDSGLIADYLDTQQFAAHVIQLCEQSALRRAVGAKRKGQG